MIKAELAHTEHIASNFITLWLKPSRPVSYAPGQSIELYLPHLNPDSRGQSRWLTISSSPTEDLLAVTTKITDTPSSFKKALLSSKPGSVLQFTDPMGDFVLPVDKKWPLVFIAGGIGITPFRSMIKFLADQGQQRDITIIYAAKMPKHLIFKGLLDAHSSTKHYIVSNPTADWKGLTGHLTADRILQLKRPSKTTRFYLSGPQSLVESLTDSLSQAIPAHRIITDYFPGYQSS